jgi:hypothetical protein
MTAEGAYDAWRNRRLEHSPFEIVNDGGTLRLVERPKPPPLTDEEMQEWTRSHPPDRVRRIDWPENGARPREAGTRKVRVMVEHTLFHTVYEQFDTPVFHYPVWEISEWDLPDGRVAALKVDVAAPVTGGSTPETINAASTKGEQS